MFNVNMALPCNKLEAVGLQDVLCPTAFIALLSVFQARKLMRCKALQNSKEMIVNINLNLY